MAEFDHGVKLEKRLGAKRDAKKLHWTLNKLGFKVDLHTDLSSEEIYELFREGNASLHTSSAFKYDSRFNI